MRCDISDESFHGELVFGLTAKRSFLSSLIDNLSAKS